MLPLLINLHLSTLTLHILCKSVCHSPNHAAHVHLAPLQYFLYNQLSCVTVQTFSRVDVAWVPKHVENALTVDLVLDRTSRAPAAWTKLRHTMLHQNTQTLLHLKIYENKERKTFKSYYLAENQRCFNSKV